MRRAMAASEAGGAAPYQTTWYWLLTRERVSGLDVFTQRTLSDSAILPIFSSAEGARAYLSDGSSSWRPRKTGRGELVSILMGVCREVRRVALDPPPGMAEGQALLGVPRERSLEPLLGRGRSWFEAEHKGQRSGTLAHASRKAF
jgi:hypothetical protein